MRDKKLIQFYITNICNSHCKTCSIWKNKERQELDVRDIEKVVKAFPDADYVIGGGEAILHSHIEIILCMLQQNKVNYTLLSNCICLERLMWLVNTYNVPTITVSFDGVAHDRIRGVGGNMAKIIDFIKWCDFNGIDKKISYTYSKYNEERFEQDMKFIKKKLGFNEIYFCLAQDMYLLKTQEIYESFVADSYEQILDCDLISKKDKAHVRGMITGVRKCCSSQNNVHTIYSNGDIVRCQSFKSDDTLGNICDMSIDEIRDVLNFKRNEPCYFDSICDLLCQRRYD